MPLSEREEDEVAAVIAETGVGMAQAHTIINALEEAGWVIDLLDPGPSSDPLGDFIVEDAAKLVERRAMETHWADKGQSIAFDEYYDDYADEYKKPHDFYDVAFQPIRTRW